MTGQQRMSVPAKFQIASNEASIGPPVYSLSKLPYKTGHVAFDVTWSVVVTLQHQLTDSKVESIDYVETSWE